MGTELSLIMPSLNVAKYIQECMDSVLNQSLDQMEIICVDAGSTDGTWEILNKYEDIHVTGRTIKCVHSDIKSYGYQVNLGIRLAKGSYIAVLETDDYVEGKMYEYLLELAKSNNLDVVKTDFDRFYTLRNGEYYYEKIALWNGSFSKYNTVINPRYDDYLYANDYNIWKGIYKKSFLIENNIWLNETPGAAFQDIGFAQQVLACAERVYYSDKSFYRYRMDRDTSSINTSKGLSYSRQEFSRLISEPALYEKLVCKQGFYRHMAQSFMVEFRKQLVASGYNMSQKRLSDDYEWFREILVKAVVASEFELGKLPDNLRGDLECLLNNCNEYIQKVYKQNKAQKEKKDSILNKVGDKNVVVFGAGRVGHAVVKILLQSGIKPAFIYDNNHMLWGESICGIPINKPLKPEEDFLVIIANKMNGKNKKKQLIDMEVPQEQIVFSEDF